jgi:thioredoxin reductase
MTKRPAAAERGHPVQREYDIAVVGGGPAGLAAAIWSARFRRSVVLIDSGEVRNRWTRETHGYLTAEAMSPAELLGRARADVARYPEIDTVHATVSRIADAEDDRFELTLADRRAVTARRVILATGVKDRLPDIDRFFDFYGSTVFTCPSCDGYEASGCDVVVWGSDTDVLEFAYGLLDWAASVTIVGSEPDVGSAPVDDTGASRVRFIDGQPVAFRGSSGQLRGVVLDNRTDVPCDVFFFTVQHDQQAPFADQLGCRRSEEGCVIVDEHCETTVDGVYAAGDMTPGPQLVQVAAAKGAIAGVGAAMSLRKQQQPPVVRVPARGVGR